MHRGSDSAPVMGEAPAAGPVRTCAGCRRRGASEQLLRFVVDERGHLRLDASRRAPGRGVHACPSRSCLTAGLKQGFARSLRRRIAAEESDRFVARTLAALRSEALDLEARTRRDGRAGSGESRARRRLALLREQAGGLEAMTGEARPQVQ